MRPILLSIMLAFLGTASAAAQVPKPAPAPTADHKKFEELKGPFTSGPEVTKACLSCHTEAAKQVLGSIHWTWQFKHPTTGQLLGKRHVINSFCGNVVTNEPRCTSCHAGYGWKDQSFDFSSEQNVDCLACHDTTGTYVKWADGAGHPLYEPRITGSKFGVYPKELVTRLENGKFRHDPPDLSKVARNIGKPDRQVCGLCHFYGGGGDNVKHGDLSSVLNAPERHIDVHMSPDGANMVCTDCHTAHGHEWPGSRYLGTVKDERKPIPGFRRPHVVNCDSCHTRTPHDLTTLRGIKLNNHTDRVACQTCHIPEFARGGVATKTWWDWSTIGKLKDGKPYSETGPLGRETYVSQKGDFRWEKDVVPTYAFWNGVVEYTLLGEKIDPESIVSINRTHGEADDAKSVIYPFKRMLGRQAYDKVHKHLLLNKVYGPDTDTALWTGFDYAKSLAAGMAATDVPFSGQYGFVNTEMWWPTTHMVAPAEEALGCDSCHARDGRLASLGGFYLPGRDGFGITDRMGLGLLLLAIIAGMAHGAIRVIASARRRNTEG